jgi:hypothetical protein
MDRREIFLLTGRQYRRNLVASRRECSFHRRRPRATCTQATFMAGALRLDRDHWFRCGLNSGTHLLLAQHCLPETAKGFIAGG